MNGDSLVLSHRFRLEQAAASRLKEVDFKKIGFSSVFSDNMFTAEYRDGRWSQGTIRPYGPPSLFPSVSALQYGMAVFDGMKAHKSPEGRPLLFLHVEHTRRFDRSAPRLAMNAVPEGLFLDALREL